ncbi:phage terminase small subunit P27 family [Aneurinibacillus thermoaerophilus]|uniref:Phage terminase, small subunit, putative, P27 family n=1 Tax=Aneurinibacillus thermoaerophilus TaxID=143495 RepID=A0A1G8ETS9_ANETH|nr:phage terminase small subunit P27 family [Aneurinibacillus thermoaerophilus]MED0757400.1 phage terminase small subunit P27 family [Aneurinibacillus thermoaerophilus]MED0762630.1 phage terminase small subunit P27 family [Aneurinibacillus thermoaerophilus]SDH73254.1 phage terminase, small subunit, putative, P27 family [Aneurinibacillus thermoaerophilus]
MAGPGRPPKPTSLKVIQGNPGKRPLNKNEPKPKAVAPKCPTFLDSEAKREWKRVAPELERLGLLTIVDGATLAAYCQAYSLWVTATKKINEHLKKYGKLTYEYTNKNGSTNEIVIPEIAIQEKALKQIKMFCTEFGFTPSSRTRMTLPSEEEQDDFEDFLKRGKKKT